MFASIVFFSSCRDTHRHHRGPEKTTAGIPEPQKIESINDTLFSALATKVLEHADDKGDMLAELGYTNEQPVSMVGKVADFRDVVTDLPDGRIENNFHIVSGSDSIGVFAQLNQPNGNFTDDVTGNERDITIVVNKRGVVTYFKETYQTLTKDGYQRKTVKFYSLFENDNYQKGDAEKIFYMIIFAGQEKTKHYMPTNGVEVNV